MMNFEKLHNRPRVLQQLTGLSSAAFQTLLEAFGRAYHDDAQGSGPRLANVAPAGDGREPTHPGRQAGLPPALLPPLPHPGDPGLPLRLQSRARLPVDPSPDPD